MKNWLDSPQTTIGGAIALVGLIMIVMKDVQTGSALIGVAATWIGISSKDSNK
jgi:hypothetical protein